MNERREFLKFTFFTLAAAFSWISEAQRVAMSNTHIPRRLVFVHGRSQQGKNPAELKTFWVEALKSGVRKYGGIFPDNLSIYFPFYGDVLDGFASRFQLPLTTDIQTKGVEGSSEFLAFQATIAEELRRQAKITDEQVDAEYGNNPKEKGPQNWEWVQAILRAIDKHASGMSQSALEVFMRDVFLYTKRAGVQREIDLIVANEIKTEPTVVIGHSLGSVVAYNILSRRSNLSVPLFVTIGSPLGIRAIRNEFRPLRYPSSVDAWLNAFDEKDVVALFPLDASNFPVNPAIENYRDVKNRTDNHHGIVGYLDDKDVARRIISAVSS